jgi:FtsZ-binding cell division protein ZapB
MDIEDLEVKLNELLNRFDRMTADLEGLKSERETLNKKLLGIQERLEGLLDRLSLMK